MSKDFYTDINLKKNELVNGVIHRVSSYPSGAREGQCIYHTVNKTLNICINDAIDTSSPLAWSSSSSVEDPTGIINVNCTAGTDVNDIVYLTGANTIAPAIGTSISTSNVIGFVVSKESSTICTLKTFGILDGFTGLIVGKTYFLSASIAGSVTDIPPTATNNVLIRIGTAFSTTKLLVNIDKTLVIRN